MLPLRPLTLRATKVVVPRAIRSQTREFHPTRPARLINEALNASAGLIHGIHTATGLSWAVSIPLTALFVRTFIGLPLQFYTRINARREMDFFPLVTSYRRRMEKWGKHEGMSKQQIQGSVRQYASYLRRRWKVRHGYRIANFLQVPVWISLMESLRGMCGSTSGLLPWLLSFVEPAENLTSSLESLHLTPEPTLANEGALWFPDLLASDPTGALPVILTASILLNIRTGWNVTTLSELSDMPTLQMYQQTFFRGLRVMIQILAINVGLSSYLYDMPAALMIYWISSTNIATLQTWFLNKYLFVAKSLPPYTPKYVRYTGSGDPFKLELR